MTSQNDTPPEDVGSVEQQICDHLRRNPDFFSHHLELLAELSIPHDTGGAVSLIEKQVHALRDDNQRLRTQFRELVDVARQNEHLSRQMHQLTLQLMAAATPAEILDTLEQALLDDFNADAVSLRIFADALTTDELSAFAGRECPARERFEELIIKGRAQCGPIDAEQHASLFDDQTDQLASVVLMPLQYHDWTGVMAVGSRDAQRYRAGMGIDLLAHLSDVMSLLLDPWVIKLPEDDGTVPSV